MQDAFGRDMFNVPNINSSRYNGHIHSSSGKSAGGKRDRKGCTKGKIEAIMKNNTVRPKVCVPVTTKKAASTLGGNHVVYTNAPIKLEGSDQEDPYTFTESEPQAALGLYQASSSSSSLVASKKHSTSVRLPNMGCAEKPKIESPRVVVKHPVAKQVLEGSSKMNKLQADIARNKVIGKRRKVEQVPSSGVPAEWSSASNAKKESGKICIAAKFVPRKSTWQKECKSRHELLQRIQQAQSEAQQYTRDLYPLGLEVSDSDDDSENSQSVYERHWFSRSSVCVGRRGGGGGTRERRVEETRTELRRKLTQTLRGLASADLPSRDLVSAVITAARKFPNATASLLEPSPIRNTHKVNRGARFLVSGEKCSYSEGCNWQSLPCTRHCSQHIMYNVDQRLFNHCTAKFSDNTQCSVPVFDVLHELPLCPEHASKHDNYNRYALESKPSKKVSKKSRVLGTSRSNKRSQKKKKKSSLSPPPTHNTTQHSGSQASGRLSEEDDFVKSIVDPDPHLPQDDMPSHLIQSTLVTEPTPNQFEGVINLNCSDGVDAVEEVSEEVLAIASLDPAELASQASRLLEEHDITNMLNQISPDAFNDLFTDKNGEYEPTREETEELERALEAVDNDVRSLERMTRSLPLPLLQLPLDTMTLLDDPPPGPFPSFQNGFPAPATTDIHPS